MVFKFFPNIKYSDKGITLVEIVVVIFIIVMFSMIVVADFPKIQRQSALSRVTYKLAQDFRKTQDLGLSGVQINDKYGNLIKAQGYGIYINFNEPITQYIIYADVDRSQTYNANQSCDFPERDPYIDCAIETIDISKENSRLYIEPVKHISGTLTSINFMPPGPTVNIQNITSGYSDIEIVLGITSDSSLKRIVLVNKAGLINVQ